MGIGSETRRKRCEVEVGLDAGLKSGDESYLISDSAFGFLELELRTSMQKLSIPNYR
jgi:hypothetical protein